MKSYKTLADGRSIVIKKAYKRVFVVVRDINDYILEAKKQFNEPRIYQDVNDNENILPKLSEVNNKMFSSLRMKGFMKEKQLKYFTCKYKKAANFGKLYLLPKFHKGLFDVPVKLVISNSGTPTEKCSVFLDHHLKNVMQK